MIKISYLEANGKFMLGTISFESLEQALHYTNRWFPAEEPLFVEVLSKKEEKEGQDA